MKSKIVLCTSPSSSRSCERSPKSITLYVFFQQGVYKICVALLSSRAFLSTCVHFMVHALPMRRCHVVHGVACAAMPMMHVARAYKYTFKCVRRVCHFLPCSCKMVQRRGYFPAPLTPQWRGELRTDRDRDRRTTIPFPTGGVESFPTPYRQLKSLCIAMSLVLHCLPFSLCCCC